MNRGKGRFEENGLLAGVGFNADGLARSGMGVDAADYDQDGWMDLFVANVDQEMYSLYHNNQDESSRTWRCRPGSGITRLMSGWGLKFFDYDNDGKLDLLFANGHPDDRSRARAQQVKYNEPLLCFEPREKGFKNVSARERARVFQGVCGTRTGARGF